ncbi:hypothetical protein AB0331_15665 [Dietzia maris]|uniref:hypothetical protein n=1 Tax=Dietzia maris TaxID=37915 RepID=UPI00344E57B3
MTSTSTLRSRAAAAVAIAASTALVLGACSDSDTQTSAATTTETVEASQGQNQDSAKDVDPVGSKTNPVPLTEGNSFDLGDGLVGTITSLRTDVSGSEIENMVCNRTITYPVVLDITVSNPDGTAPVETDDRRVGIYSDDFRDYAACTVDDIEGSTWAWPQIAQQGTVDRGQEYKYTAYFDFNKIPADQLAGFEVAPSTAASTGPYFTDLGDLVPTP